MINKQRLIKLTQKVISYDSTNPPGRELALSKFIEKDMKSLGLQVKKYTFAKNRPNIVATLKGKWPRKKAAKEAILLTPHFDTVPFGKGWKYDPLGGKVVGGKIYGRGASDDKGNLASCMEVMRSLVEDSVQLNKDVIMAATVDEETGSHYGIGPLVQKKILKPAFALIMDSTEFDAVVVQKGLVHCTVKIFGKKAHGAYNWRGVNAVEIAARIINKLTKLKFKYKKHPLLAPPTMNIGTIGGGEKVNMVPDYCEFTVDHRFLPGMKAKDSVKKIKDVIKSETRNFEIDFEHIQDPFEIASDHPLVESYIKLCRKMGNKAKCKGSEGATVLTFFGDVNIPTFATGFGAHKTAHITDEYIYIKSLYRGTKVLEEYVKLYDSF